MPAVVCSTSCLSLSCWQLGQHHIKLHHPLVFVSKNTTISNLLFYLVLKYYSFFQMQSHLVLSVLYSQLSISSMFHNSHIMSMFFLYSQMFCKKYSILGPVISKHFLYQKKKIISEHSLHHSMIKIQLIISKKCLSFLSSFPFFFFFFLNVFYTCTQWVTILPPCSYGERSSPLS